MGTVAEAARLSLPRVIGETVRITRAGLLPVCGLSLLLDGLPNAALSYFTANQPLWGWATTASTGLAFLTSALVAGAIIHAAGALLDGRLVSFRASMAAGLRFFLPLLAASIITTVCIAVGLVLLVVPGLIVMATWFVPFPCIVLEGRGILSALDRSRDLTRGNRLALLALGLVFGIGAGGFVALLGGLALSAPTAGAGYSALLEAAIDFVLSPVLATPLWVGTTVAYAELRRIREGAAFGLADVFS